MRFDGLHLVAYGPFTDRRLDLSAGAFGVHVVFGPNEAGKSSALRALRALLFGFPHQTDDAFLHPYARLEVGAQLRRPDGSVLTCYRRKRLRDSLLAANREPLPDDILEPLLGGVDAALFGALYGIDDLALERGGRALLEERGRESEALFGAGLGRVAAHRVLTELDAEAEALFAPRASTRTLNKLLKQADELRQRERDATLLTSRFEALREEARQARRALESAEAAHAEAVRELAHLRRVRAALGPLDRLAGARRRLHAIGDVPALPEDFGRRLEAAQEQRRRAHTRQGDACAREKALVAELHTCVVNEALLSRADEVEMLRDRAAAQRAGAGEDARRALEAEGLRKEEAALRQRLPEALRDATGEDLDAWLGCRRRAEELIETGSRVLGANEDARARRDDAGAERERRRAALEALSEAAQLAGLRDSVAAVHRAGDVDARLAEARREREAAARRVEEDCAALGRWPHDPDALLCAQLPDAETVRAFVERARGLALEARRLDEAEAAALARRDEAREQLRALELRGPVPGEDDLVAARAHRDEGWRLLQARWVESAPDVEAERSFAGPRGIASAFESAVRAADEVADRLRREATMVAAASQTRAAAERAAGDLEALAGRRDALARESRAQEAHWRSLWSALAIEAGTPAEMEAWLHGATVLRERLRRLTERRDREAALAAERDALGARLAQELADAGVDGAGRAEALHALRVRAEAVIAEADRAAAERERARAALDDAAIAASRAESEAARAARAHAEWREAWGALARSLALDPAVPPGALRDHFELLLALHRVRAALAEAAARREATRRGVARLTADLEALCRAVAPHLAGTTPLEAAPALAALLSEARTAQAHRERVRRDLAAAREQREDARRSLADAGDVLEALRELAGGVAVEQLADVESRVREHRQAKTALAEAETELTRISEGLPLAALAAEAEARDPDALDAALERLEARLAGELAPRRDACRDRTVNAERDLAELGVGAGASDIAAERAQVLATVRVQAARYLRLRLAERVLREQMERFSAEHRDPLLAAAGRHLTTLTGGDFAAVVTESDDDGSPVLAAVRGAGERLRVDALSTGTRDQLYLALRLACLEHLLERSPPVPLVADDVLVHFDDARARATLETLAQFSRRTQVLLFTHHERIARDAEALSDCGGGVFLHRL